MAQLNIRTALEEQKRPDINIVCEKIAFQGLTRFEDRQCLPLGVSTNFTAYSAKLLTQVRCRGVFTSPSACCRAADPFQGAMTSWSHCNLTASPGIKRCYSW